MTSPSWPSADELRSTFDELVGTPLPSADLAERSRRRGTALRRRRASVVTAGVATVTVLVVPSVIAVRHGVSSGFGAGSDKGSVTAPAASAKPGVTKTEAPDQNGTKAQKQQSLLGTPPGVPNGDSYTVVEKAPTAQDDRRIAAAQHLLGSGFTKVLSGVALDAMTGAEVGTSATFRSAAGESVGVVWATVDPAEKGTVTSTDGTAGVSANGSGVNASGDPAAGTVQAMGGAGIKGNLQVSVKVTEPADGTGTLTTDKVDELVQGLLAAES